MIVTAIKVAVAFVIVMLVAYGADWLGMKAGLPDQPRRLVIYGLALLVFLAIALALCGIWV